MSSFKNALCMSASTLILAGYADALDLAHPLPTTHTHTLELKPIQSDGIQLAGVYFLPDFSDESFADYSDIGRNYNTGVCQDPKTLFTTSNCTYPRTVDKRFLCPFIPGHYRKCSCLPQFKISSCPSPKYLSSPRCDGKAERCLCPPSVSLSNPNDKCTQTCDGVCIDKSCTPLKSETGCAYGTNTVTDNCEGTRTVCKPCASGGSASCSGQITACSSSQVQTSVCKDCFGTTHYSCRAKTCSEKGMKDCNGSCIAMSACCGCSSAQVCYNASCCTPSKSETGCQHGTNTVADNCGGTKTVCKACSLAACSSISSKPANSSYTTGSCTDCSGTKTVNTGWTCNSGYNKSGNSCVVACSLPDCSSVSSKPANSSYTTGSCTDCSGTKTVNTGWSCNSGYTKSGSSCVVACNLTACSSISSKPANSSYTTGSCTDCNGTKTVNTGWTCNSGYNKSGSSCVQACNLTPCSGGISSKPTNSSYTTKSCTDCDGTKTINSGWTCDAGYFENSSGDCVSVSCGDEGYLSEPAGGEAYTCSTVDVKGKTCYTCSKNPISCSSPKVSNGSTCVCPSSYTYTSSNCGGTLSGSSCDGKYTGCITPNCNEGGYYDSQYQSGYSCTPVTYKGTTCYDCVVSTGSTDTGGGGGGSITTSQDLYSPEDDAHFFCEMNPSSC